jgi:hypothetical protein
MSLNLIKTSDDNTNDTIKVPTPSNEDCVPRVLIQNDFSSDHYNYNNNDGHDSIVHYTIVSLLVSVCK